jgi:monothiol glutaredoxin
VSDPSPDVRVTQALSSARVVLFLKGTRARPSCRFSGQAVELLDSLLPDYATFDVKSDPELKAAVTTHAKWDAFPQLYVEGELVGGVDSLKELFVNGGLARRLGVAQPDLPKPQLHLSHPAHQQLLGSLGQTPVRIDRDAEGTLRLAASRQNSSDLVVKLGELTFVFDVIVARYVDGLRIDWLDEPGGYLLRTVAEAVRQLPALALADLLASGKLQQVVDVRTQAEFSHRHLPGATFLTRQTLADLLQLDRRTPLVFVCAEGSRSQHTAEHFVADGFTEIYCLQGGLHSWEEQLGPLPSESQMP